METRVFKNTSKGAEEYIQGGGLVAVPTETVYGLAANGLCEEAVSRIYEVKGRPAFKPLSLMVHGKEAMERYCLDVPPQAYLLADKFWPGPLTIVLKAKDCVPAIVLAGGSTVGLRCPDHPLTLELLNACALPLAAPSANPSGEPSPKNAETVLKYFDGKIEAVIDGGDCGIGTESTLIDMSAAPYRILRRGALSEAEIAEELVKGLCIFGITGGTGCGKTSALHVLEQLGALVLDCDAVYHGLLEHCREMLDEIEESFPGVVVDGALQRKKLGALVFSDKARLKELNRITHKYVGMEINRLLQAHAMNGGRLAAIDAIELLSAGLDSICTKTFAVLADKEKRIERIMSRDGISRDYAQMRVEAQPGDSYYINGCDQVLYNNSDSDSFAQHCRKVFKEAIKNG